MMIKRSILVLLAILMTVQGMIPLVHAAQTEVEYDAGQYAEAIEELNALGMTENLGFSLSEGVVMTRGDFITLCMHIELSGLHNVDATSPFSDVMASDSAAWAIAAAREIGVVEGSGGRFEPYEPVSLEAAAKILVSILGYKPQALERGGFPAGYLAQAVALGLKKEEPANAAALTMGEVAAMVLRALDTQVLNLTAVGNQNRYEAREGFTWLTRSFDITKHYGTVEADAFTGLYSTQPAKENGLVIDGKSFSASCDTSGLLGMYVVYYVKSEDTLVYVRPENNRILMIDSDDISRVADRTLYYFANGSEKSVCIPKDVAVIYNHICCTDYTMEMFKAENGYVELIAGNGGSYRVAKIAEYQPAFAAAIDAVGGKVTDAVSGKEIVVSELDRLILVGIDGQEMDLKDLPVCTLLDMQVSRDQKSVWAQMVKNVVKGKVEGVNSSTEPSSVIVNAERVELSPKAGFGIAEMMLGKEITLYLDSRGKAAYYLYGATAEARYAYLIAASVSGAFGGNYKFKIYDSDGVVKELNGAQRIKLNGTRLPDGTVLPAELSQGTAITYQTDEYGNVSSICTPDALGSDLVSLCDEGQKMFYQGNGNYAFANQSGSAFTGSFCVDANTLMLDIPTDANQADEKYFGILNPIQFSNFSIYTVAAYTQNSGSNVAEFVVSHRKEDEELPLSIEAAVVTEITDAINLEGNLVKKLVLTNKSLNTAELYTVDDSVAADVEFGDIISYKTNALGEMDSVRILLDAEKRTGDETVQGVFDPKLKVNGAWYANTAIFHGYVYSNYAGIIRFASIEQLPTNVTAKDTLSFRTTNLRILELDKNGKTESERMRIMDSAALTAYIDSKTVQEAYLYVKSGTPNFMVIYR